MIQLSKKELDLYSNKILEDYDTKNPSLIFKDKIKITNEDALLIQSNVAQLREKRGEEIEAKGSRPSTDSVEAAEADGAHDGFCAAHVE